MLATALLIVIGLLIAGVCILGLNTSLERRINRRVSPPDEDGGGGRNEALRHISRDTTKGQSGGFF